MTSALYPTRLPCGNRVLDLAHTHVMGILNATPDSFSDGGRYSQLDAALRHAEAMVLAGATLIDVGGESTRPGARPVSPAQEVERVAPVVEIIARELDVIISVDTSTPEVMLATAGLGAGLINDVRSLQRPGALEAAASTGLPVCLMHMQGEPGTMQNDPHYEDLLAEVSAFLLERMNQCVAAGIDRQQIILDPGFGFAKTLEHNLSLFKRMEALHALGRPLLVGVSRKSMIGAVLGRPVDQRLSGGLALAALAMTKGAKILRVHDVAETADVVRMIAAVQAAE
ncbi:dihydropteroate synthase [Pseudomonas syringae pv. actinidiae]|uniref:Dihydropteroate synthase n=4 Tax=Pseudomonas syringae group TaxID=136849 RepID=A0AAN4QA42_PSESF|nr:MULTISPECIES: dihydropteroate synthase [Pseudomonas syringae group]EPN70897.1 dihydropteroate synthase [Pseudomonas syringae pv. actinidiae ICMP 19101]MDU8428057.1 dihydropteroate synthase [Pseudomonas syringae pv. actinidifoliorum]AKT32297.1 dihydropteroate synthase [Pseudomonas syringae pv. actinidiae ICMP 18884]AOE58637.1 dihydropteroate synthase [Pseudomonas syringae pv. actinidiae ICMP 18708]APP99591.1 dihydropteroate synthase [Pseudomonas syringae pv. actinidiae]